MTIDFPYHLSAFVTSKAQGYSISPGVFLVGYLDIKTLTLYCLGYPRLAVQLNFAGKDKGMGYFDADGKEEVF